jgi:hypothetical protein
MGQMKKILSNGGEPGPLPVGQDWAESRPLGTSSSRHMNGQIDGYSTFETEFAMIYVIWFPTVGPQVLADLQGVKKSPSCLLRPGALNFMPISSYRIIRGNHTRQTIIQNSHRNNHKMK